MYNFSLEFYVRVFKKSIKEAEKPIIKKSPKRLTNLLESLKACVFYEISRSIFVKHKIIFAVMLTLTDLDFKKSLNHEDLKFMISELSGAGVINMNNPEPELFSQKKWDSVMEMSNLVSFAGLSTHISSNLSLWRGFL